MLKKTFRLYRNYYVALLKLGVPIMIGQLGIIVVGFADNIMVGHHTPEELAAASFVNNLFNLPLMFALGFSLGLTPLIGNLVGKNQVAKAGQTLRYGLIANLLLAILLIGIMSVVYVNIDRMGQPEELLPLIRPYFLIHLSGLVFIMLFNAFKQFADGIMDTRISMYILLCGNVLNIIGNYLLIFGPGFFPELGLLGAGFSTLLSRIFTLSVFVYLFFFTSRYGRFKEGFRHFKGDTGKQLFHLTKMGMPIALQMGMETGSFNLSVIMMGWIGTAALAAHQAVATFTTIGFMLYYGIGSAITILVSNAKGAGEMNKVRLIANAGFHVIILLAVCIVVIMALFRQQVGYLFTDSEEVNRIVALLIIPTMVYQFGDGLQVAYANALRGIGDVKPMALIAFISYFLVCLPAAYLFGFVCQGGAMGIWWGFPIGLTLAGVLFYSRFKYKMKNTKIV